MLRKLLVLQVLREVRKVQGSDRLREPQWRLRRLPQRLFLQGGDLQGLWRPLRSVPEPRSLLLLQGNVHTWR